jgi:hypothetical protein
VSSFVRLAYSTRLDLTYVRVPVDAPPLGESGGEEAMVGEVGLVRRLLGDAADLALKDDDDDDDSAATVVDDTESSDRSKKDLNSMKMKGNGRSESWKKRCLCFK